MEELLNFLLTEITGEEDFEIEKIEEDGVLNFNVKADTEHMGLIIGKNGKTIKAIQEIMRVRGKLEDKGVYVNIEEK